MMSKAHDDFSAAFDRFLDEVGVTEAMVVATNMFVSMVVGYIKHNGEDANKSTTIVGNWRDITIHPPKTAQCATDVRAAKQHTQPAQGDKT